MGKSNSTANAYRSEGHKLLLSRPESASVIAAKIEASKSTITAIRRGESRPTPETRRALAEHFSIPVASWDQRADAPTLDVEPPAPPTGPAPPTPATLREVLEQLEDARRQPGLTPSELAKLSSEIRHVITAIATHQRLDRESDQRIRARALELVEPLRGAILELVGHHPDVVNELLDIIDARLARVS